MTARRDRPGSTKPTRPVSRQPEPTRADADAERAAVIAVAERLALVLWPADCEVTWWELQTARVAVGVLVSAGWTPPADHEGEPP